MPPLDFAIEIHQDDDSDDERLFSLTSQLQRDLYELGADSVERPSPIEKPDGTKGDPISLGLLAVAALPVVLPAMVGYLQSWTARDKGRRVRIKSGDLEIEFTPDANLGQAEILAIIRDFESRAEPAPSPTPAAPPRPKKILFLAANPKDTSALRLDEEIRAIDAALRHAEFRDRFDLQQQWAVRISDLQSHLLRYQPDIVHFSGHGSESGEIVLEDQAGFMQPVPIRGLYQLFRTLKDNIRCVVLNACFSEFQAQAIAEHIDCVVGMSAAVGDQAAIKFAAAFYQALGYGRSIQVAYDLGRNGIDLEGLDDQEVPQLICRRGNPGDIYLLRDYV